MKIKKLNHLDSRLMKKLAGNGLKFVYLRYANLIRYAQILIAVLFADPFIFQIL